MYSLSLKWGTCYNVTQHSSPPTFLSCLQGCFWISQYTTKFKYTSSNANLFSIYIYMCTKWRPFAYKCSLGRMVKAYTCTYMYMYNVHVLIRDERRKEERSKHGQTTKEKQHSTPQAVTLPKKNELPQVGLEPTTLYILDRALYH